MEIPYVFVLYNQLKTDHLARIPFNLGATGYTASIARPWVLGVYHQFSLKSMEIPYVSVLYNLLKTYHVALIPFNFGAKGSKASVADPWALPVYHQFSLKSMEISYVSVLYNQLKTDHLARIPFNWGATFKKRNNSYPRRSLHWLPGPVPVEAWKQNCVPQFVPLLLA